MIDYTFVEVDPLAPDSHRFKAYLSATFVCSLKDKAEMCAHTKQLDLLRLTTSYSIHLTSQPELNVADSLVFTAYLIAHVNLQAADFFFVISLQDDVRNFRAVLQL